MVRTNVDERRAAIRAKRVMSIQYRLVESETGRSDSHWHLSTTHDMSILGLSWLSPVNYRVGDVLEVKVVMSGILDVFNGFVKIVRTDRKTTGAFFLVAAKFIDHKRKTAPATKRGGSARLRGGTKRKTPRRK